MHGSVSVVSVVIQWPVVGLTPGHLTPGHVIVGVTPWGRCPLFWKINGNISLSGYFSDFSKVLNTCFGEIQCYSIGLQSFSKDASIGYISVS